MQTSRRGSTTDQERQHDYIKLIQAATSPRCQHVRTNGTRCGSPAMRRRKFCYFHEKLRTQPATILIPTLEDANAIQMAIQQFVQAVLNGTLEHKTASLALYGLQTASSNLAHTDFEPAEEDVIIDANLNTAECEDEEETRKRTATTKRTPTPIRPLNN
ncbi:MAG: hypothetical protein NVS9B15_05810 [Acidobacteriaceae bacterium]